MAVSYTHLDVYKRQVLSDLPVFREITEHQGFYFSPESADSMASAMHAVLSSSAEQQRLVD